jgi:hypothetical protein
MPVADAAGAARPSKGATALKVVAKNRTSITLTWRVAPSAKRWLAAQRASAKPTFIVLRNGVPKARTKATRYRFTSLTCNKQYKLEVAMLGPSGKAVTRTGVKARTTACTGTGGTGGTAADRTAPSAPKDLAASAVTPTSVTVSWTAATDDVGVTGYAVSRDGNPLSPVTAPSAVVDGLACGTSYVVGVAAVDAAGNNSALATLGVVTSACPPVDIPASVFLSPSGNDANPCTAAAPCRNFDRANAVAQPGQHVELAAGSYGSQSLRANGRTSADDVVFRPAAGASVTTGSLTVNANHVTLRGFTVNGGWTTNDATDDVTFQNLVVNGSIFINSSSNIRVLGGSVGGVMDEHPQFASWPVGTRIENILVDGVTFHDVRRSNSSVHGECLQIAGGVGVTVRNSTFVNCMVFDLSITEYNGSGPPTNYLIENNVFAPAADGGFYSLHFNVNATDFRNFVVRNNSSAQAFSFTGVKVTNVVVTGNVAPNSAGGCVSGITYRKNVWNGAKCGATDVNAPLGFVNAGAVNYHLAPGAAALNFATAADAPSTDHDGVGRPMGAAPDAGADEDG